MKLELSDFLAVNKHAGAGQRRIPAPKPASCTLALQPFLTYGPGCSSRFQNCDICVRNVCLRCQQEFLPRAIEDEPDLDPSSALPKVSVRRSRIESQETRLGRDLDQH
jgi:hypothetical protein